MKKLYFAIAVFLLNFSVRGQIVDIPDVNFKNALLNTLCASTVGDLPDRDADTNDDGEIELSEALSIGYLNVDSQNISSIEGLSAFSNLQFFYCNNNNLTALNLNGLDNLIELHCAYNSLTTIDLGNKNIVGLICSHNFLTNITWNPNNNPIDAITVDVSYNLFTNLQLPASTSAIEGLDISGNPMANVVIPDVELREMFRCENMPNLISIEYRAHYFYSWTSMIISNNPNLQYVNFRNGHYEYMHYNNDQFSAYYWIHPNPISNCPALQSICVDDDEIYYLPEYFGNTNVAYTTYCSFAPSTPFNTLAGTIRFNLNGNGCNTLADASVNLPIAVTTQSGYAMGSAFTNVNGNFVSYSSSPQNLIYTPQFGNAYYTVTPTSFTSAFSGYGNTETVDFCITPNGTHSDLAISLIPITPARPGFDAKYKIIFRNNGTIMQSGNITSNFSDDIFDFIIANPTAESIPNTLNWGFSDLQPLESREINFILNLNSPAEMPAVNIGDQITLTAIISSPQPDEAYFDNTSNYTQIVTGSYDPNDKQVSALITAIDGPLEYLNYTIRFQNTGTAAAENVVVADVLDERFDKNSLIIVSASHPYLSRLVNNKLEFIFEGIDLIDSATNEPESHGYVTFKVRPKPGSVDHGDIIENKANIYFDYNLPIETNAAITSYYSILGTEKLDTQKAFKLSPNPAKNLINISIPSNAIIKSIRIYNTLGQLLHTAAKRTIATTVPIDISQLRAGTYFVEIETGSGKSIKKFIKI